MTVAKPRDYSSRQLRDIGELVKRAEWRSGEICDRLARVEQRAALRGSGDAYSGDRKQDRRIAKLAKKVRQAMEAEHG